MRSSILPIIVCVASCATTLAPAPPAEPPPSHASIPAAPIRASKIVLVGDSTTAVQGGWGGSFCAEHVTSFAACVNLARGGRSSGSYLAEGSWELALAEMRTPGFVNTWVLIQFGHNDQPGKPGRSTDLATEFPANIRRYVNEARAAGAKPVLLTPLTRRMFKDGVLQDDLAPWAAATAGVAAEMNVPLVDLHGKSRAAIEAMGSPAANKMAQRTPSAEVAEAATKGTSLPASTGVTAIEVNDRPAIAGMAQPKLSFDYTHLGRTGADYFSTLVTAELALAVPELRPLLIP